MGSTNNAGVATRARGRWAIISVTLAVVTSGLSLAVDAAPADAAGFPRSESIALVPNASGRQSGGGTFPTSGFPNGYAPTFTDVAIESIRDGATNPIAAGFDTVVLNSVCDIGSFLADPEFKNRIEGFVAAGGKLLIWDSECPATDYSGFAIPFQTSNPGQLGAQGTLVDIEENSLSSTDPSSANFINVDAVAAGTDAVGDANVFTTFDSRWFVDLRATNAVGVDGPVQAYANLGSGIVIYNGLDKDFLPGGSFNPTATDGVTHLNRIWLLDLLLPWNPDDLPHSNPAIGSLVIRALAQTSVVGVEVSPTAEIRVLVKVEEQDGDDAVAAVVSIDDEIGGVTGADGLTTVAVPIDSFWFATHPEGEVTISASLNGVTGEIQKDIVDAELDVLCSYDGPPQGGNRLGFYLEFVSPGSPGKVGSILGAIWNVKDLFGLGNDAISGLRPKDVRTTVEGFVITEGVYEPLYAIRVTVHAKTLPLSASQMLFSHDVGLVDGLRPSDLGAQLARNCTEDPIIA